MRSLSSLRRCQNRFRIFSRSPAASGRLRSDRIQCRIFREILAGQAVARTPQREGLALPEIRVNDKFPFMKHVMKQPFVIAACIVVIPVLAYALSFGPICWMADREVVAPDRIAVVYRPLLQLSRNGPAIVSRPLCWYANIATRTNSFVLETLYIVAGVASDRRLPPTSNSVLRRASVL